jgi:cytidine deaminase
MAPLQSIITLAQSKAKQSICRFRVSAVGLDKRGRIVGCTSNRLRFLHKGGGVHAEIALIKKYGKQLKSIFICRINKSGELMNIHPCKNCQEVIDKLNIKVYSISKEKQ